MRAHEIAIQIIQEKTWKNAENKNAYWKVVEKAYHFLLVFAKDNNENSNILLKYIDDFLEDLNYGAHALELIKEIFTDNENLVDYNMTPLIRRLAVCIDSIEIESAKKATLISYMPSFMRFRDEYQRQLQYLILSEFTSSARKNLNYLYVGEHGLKELEIIMEEMRSDYAEFMSEESKMPEIVLPPEMSYTLQYLNLIASSGIGKNIQCETRAQALFPMKDLIRNM